MKPYNNDCDRLTTKECSESVQRLTTNLTERWNPMCKLNRISSLTSKIVVIALICTISSTALAGIIPINGVQSISGPGLGTVSVPIILTANPDNDNQLGGGPLDNNITIPIKRFDKSSYIDI
jgi:hypothetical protein